MPHAEHPLPSLLRPAGPAHPRAMAVAAVILLLLSAVWVVLAAWAMPAGYDWRALSISESAAQGQRHGWIARLGFLCFGAGVLLLSLGLRGRWPRLSQWACLAFAAAMFGAAAFSHAPWQAGVASDPVEDLLHSVCATGMGIAFCIAVGARFLQRGPGDRLGRTLDALALLAAVLLPTFLAAGSEVGGLMQRLMFGVAYLWFGREALLVFRSDPEAGPQGSQHRPAL